MKKTISILSTIAFVFSSIAFTYAFAVLTFLWESIAVMFNVSKDAIEGGAVAPIGTMLQITGCMVFALLLMLSSKKGGRVFVIEIISIIVLIAVLPPLVSILGVYQNMWMARFGAAKIAALAITNSVLGISVSLSGFASSLCILTCGMRIADKVHMRKQIQK